MKNLYKYISKEDLPTYGNGSNVVSYEGSVYYIEYTNNDFVTNWLIELLDSGYTIDDFKKVIDNKSDEWGNDPEKNFY